MVGRSHQATSTARTTRWLVAALALCACASTGCAAYRASQQPDKKDLSVLSRGTPRSRVIAELGAPVNTDHEDGKTVDLFVFKQGYTKGVKTSRALVHGAADVVTGGLWEVVGIPAEAIADGRDVKVEVTYDERRAIESMDVIEGQDVITPRRWFQRKNKSKPAAAAETARKSDDDERSS